MNDHCEELKSKYTATHIVRNLESSFMDKVQVKNLKIQKKSKKQCFLFGC